MNENPLGQTGQNSTPTPPVPAPPQQPYYVGTMPAEPQPKVPGRMEGVIAIICACISILFIPILFGVIGIILGIKSKNKGQKTLGTVAIVLSAVFMGVGMVLGVLVNMHLPASQSFMGVW
jgi:hypothetical protein